MDYIKVLKDLIAINTTVPPGLNYGKAVSYLEPLFKEAGFETHIINIPGEHADGLEGRTNLIAHRRSPGEPHLIFYGHIDVVPAEGWDAFNPRVENGKLYGRGASDMKGSLVALLLGLEKLKEKPIKYDVSVMVTTDEETGQASQIRYLGQFLEPLAGSFVFSLDSEFGYVGIANLGVIEMGIKVKGKSVHSGLSHLGINAIEQANLLINALLEYKKQVARRKSEVLTNPDIGLTRMEARLNINKIQGGLKFNIIPDECCISVDRRLIPEENLDEADKELRDVIASVKGVECEVEPAFKIPTVPACKGPVVDELADIIKQVTGKTGKFGIMGSGDLPSIAYTDWGAQEFGLGVSRPECNIHGKNEFAYLKDIEDLAEIITRFLSPD